MKKKRNKKKEIWYCHHYAGTPNRGMSLRPYYLSKCMLNEGHRVTVIASCNHHLLSKAPSIDKKYLLKNEMDVPYLWINTPKYKGNGIRRILNMISYALFLKRNDLVKKKILMNPDIIIVSSAHPFHVKAMKYWAKKYHAKLVFEVRDIWPLSLIEILGISPKHLLVLILNNYEKFAYKNADIVVSLLPFAFDHMVKQGLGIKKYFFIPNGAMIKDNNENEIDSEIKIFKRMGKFIVMYVGAHGIPNALEPLISCAKILQSEKNQKIHFILIGEGTEKEKLAKYAKKYCLNNITFLKNTPHNKVHSFLNGADVCYIGWLDLPIYKFGVSANKLFDYMLAKKPIIQSINSVGNIVEKAKCGVCIPPMSPLDIAKSVKDFSKMQNEELIKYGINGYEYLINNHSYKILSKKYIKIFE